MDDHDLAWAGALLVAAGLALAVGFTWGRWTTWRRIRRPMAELRKVANELTEEYQQQRP